MLHISIHLKVCVFLERERDRKEKDQSLVHTQNTTACGGLNPSQLPETQFRLPVWVEEIQLLGLSPTATCVCISRKLEPKVILGLEFRNSNRVWASYMVSLTTVANVSP